MPRFDWKRAAELYQSGLSTTQIGKLLNAAAPNILRALKLSNIPIRGISEAKVLRALGARSKQTGGYVFIHTGKGKRKLEHVLIAERALGRPLRRNEHVHHINGQPADNRNTNLLVCSRGYHIWLHHQMRKRRSA